ncbi:MAG: dTMP kinase [Propionibacteriaceae bacterium]|jgi:dTMP kinase|nr:dTMP kinase [Propionibacteriaceae bacterium]
MSLFIVFEGGDGAGKSTQAGLLADWLEGVGCTVTRTFQPGHSRIGAVLRQLLLDPASGPLSPRAEALLYAADKAQHADEVIRPALARGEVVVSDRYVDSMIAYQGAGRRLDPDEVAKLAWWAVGALPPDLTVLLDAAVEDGVGAKTDRDRLEQAGEAFHERVRSFFLALAAAAPERYLVLPARRPVAELAAAVRTQVAARLGAP